jgi:tetratricopeptide (TPR) repeat protein
MAVAGRDGIGIAKEEVRAELERVVSSTVFSRSERMKRFLTYAVEQSLSADSAGVKEYTIALAVYDKSESFDPRIDPIVRVEASRLRAKLREYYEDEGRDDPVIISIRKKGYSALFKKRQPQPLADSAALLAQAIVSDSTQNAEAQYFYLRGRHYWNRRTPEGIAEATECFKQAIVLDPRYALAYAGLADCYASQAWFEMDYPSRVWQASEDAAKRLWKLTKPSARQRRLWRANKPFTIGTGLRRKRFFETVSLRIQDTQQPDIGMDSFALRRNAG